MTKRTAHELAAMGRYLSEHGNLVVILLPSQEWMAVEAQEPFLRSEPLPSRKDRPP